MKLPFKENLILFLAILIFLFIELGVFAEIGSDNLFLAQLFSIKRIKVLTPNGGENWDAGQTYKISWTMRGIDKVGIVLFKGESPEWIIKNIPAKDGKYEWQIPSWQEPSRNYKIAIFEYPWQKGNKIDYSDQDFTISGTKFASCDTLSLIGEYPYLASNFPNLRKVFITIGTWKGNLGGLEGADEKCQKEAEKEGFSGTWKALLGDDRTLAIDRLKLDGVFVEAEVAAILPGGQTCHRLLGENFEKFLEKFSNLWVVNREKLSEDFLRDFSNLWLGRINDKSPKDCIYITSQYPSKVLAENYSFTTTCQNWTEEDEKIKGYPPIARYTPEYPKCYTSYGKSTNAVGQAGLSSGLTGGGIGGNSFTPSQGKTCDTYQKLLCVEQ
jgi:hypothetical protein